MINEEDVIARDLPLLRQRMQAEAAAEGRKLEDSSDEELTKRAEEMGGDASNYQSAYTFGRRADGTPGLDINKPRQKTLAQLIRGDQEPLPAFFEGVTDAMQQAISEINTQRINYKVSPNAGREVETRPLGDDPVNLAVRYGEGTTQQTQAPLAKQRIRVRDEAVARSGAEKLFGTRAEREQAVRSSDVAGQNAMAAMQGGPEVRAEYMNKRLAAELAKMDAAGQEPTDEDIVRIRTEIMEDVLTNVFREQEFEYNQLGVAVDTDTQMFKPVLDTSEKPAPQPLQSGVGQLGDGRGLLGDVREVFRDDDVQFVDTTWKHYTGVLTPEKRERALNDLKVYETLSKEEKFPPELMDVVKTVAASKPSFAGSQLSYTEIKDYLSRISYVESKHKNISQIGGGTAVSAFQIEPVTAESLINLERVSKKYFNSSDFNEALDDEFDRVAETNPELMSGYLSYKNQGEDKAVYKAMQDLSIEQITKLMSVSPAFAGSVAYAKIITGLKSNVRKKDKEKLEKARAERETRQGMQEGGVPLPRNKPSVTEKKKVAS